MAALGARARVGGAGVVAGQVQGQGLGVVEAVVPGQQVRVGDDLTRATLVGPRLGDVLEGDLNVVGARAVRGGGGLVIGEDVAVEPQAVGRVVQVDRG